MKFLRKGALIPLFFIILGSGVVAYYLFFNYFIRQHHFEQQTLQAFDALLLMDYKLDNTYQTALSYLNYDAMVKLLQEHNALMEQLQQKLAQLDSDVSGETSPMHLFNHLVEKSRMKQEGLERFKAVNAMLNNSLRYLYELYEQALPFIGESPEERAVRIKMGRFMAGISVSAINELEETIWSKKKIQELHLPPNHPAEEILQLFRIHAVKLLEGSQIIRELIVANQALRLSTDLEDLRNNVSLLFQKRQAFWIMTGNTAFAMGTVFFVLFVILYFHEEKLKRQLARLNADLEHRVEVETAKRQDQEQLLIQQSKMAAMGEMIGAIAHQWRRSSLP